MLRRAIVSISFRLGPPEARRSSAPVDQEALIKEARRRARRRRQRNLVGAPRGDARSALARIRSSVEAGPQSGSAFLSESSSPSATPPRAALPEELSYNANGGIVLVRRDGTRRALAEATFGSLPNGRLARSSVQRDRVVAGRLEAPRSALGLATGARRHRRERARSVRRSLRRSMVAGRPTEPESRSFVTSQDSAACSTWPRATDAARSASPRTSRHFSWSPDGRSSRTRAGARGTGHRGCQRSCGATPVPIAAGRRTARQSREVQWSPDASLIAFATGRGVFVVRPDGTSLRRGGRRERDRVVAGQRLFAVARGSMSTSSVPTAASCADRPLPVHVPWRDGNVARLVARRQSDRVRQRTRQRREHDPPGRNRTTVVAPRAVAGPSGLAVGWPLWRPDRSG